MNPNPYLVGTSLLFIVPASYAAYTRFWSACAVLTYLMTVSSIYHATKNNYLFYLDQTACILYALYTMHQSYKHGLIYVWYVGTGFTVLVYYGGYLTQSLVYSRNLVVATVCYGVMHLMVNACGMIVIYLVDCRAKAIQKAIMLGQLP
jgi:hypothetical protein